MGKTRIRLLAVALVGAATALVLMYFGMYHDVHPLVHHLAMYHDGRPRMYFGTHLARFIFGDGKPRMYFG
jgi:hypothetical protein